MKTVEAIAASSAGEPEGVATLNSGGTLTEAQLPGSVEIGSPPPTGVAATDTANVKAALKAAGEVTNGVAVINKPGTYAIDEELIRPYTAAVVIGPATTLQAVAAMENLLSDPANHVTFAQSITGGGSLDANNQANHALWCRNFSHLVIDIEWKNSLEDDLILGDPGATAASHEPVFGPHALCQRTAGTVPVGHSCIWARRAGDGRIPGTVVTGQETGIKVDSGSGGWRGIATHPVGAGYAMQVCIDDNGAGEWFGVNLDTPTPKAHVGATGSGAFSTITDTEILAQHLLRPVSGTNIPAESFVGTVTPGASFVLVNAKGEEVKPTGTVAGITLAGVGILRRTGQGNQALGGQIFISPTYGVDGNTYGIVMGPTGVGGDLYGFHAQGGEAGNYRVQRALTGNLAKTYGPRLLQVNYIEANPETSLPSEGVTAASIGAEAVTAAKLANEAVETGKIKGRSRNGHEDRC